MLAYGIKLGSSRAIVDSFFKGQNIFPAGVLGDPLGHWDPQQSVVDSLRLYAYRHLFDHSKLYAFRNVSQLPSACPAPSHDGFSKYGPVGPAIGRLPAKPVPAVPHSPVVRCHVKVLRTSIIEDLFMTWFKRNLMLIPIPAKRSAEDIAALRNAGERVITRDKDLANAHRHVERLIQDSPKKSLFELFAENNPVVTGADLTGASAGAEVTAVHEQGDEVVSNEMFFYIRLPNSALRKYVTYMLGRMLDEDEDVTLDVDTLGKVEVPANLEAVAAAIDQMQSTDPASAFQDAQMNLDRVVAGLFGMSEEDLKYITSAMTNDGFLKQLKPSLEHRGLRIQPYADHSQGDRYT